MLRDKTLFLITYMITLQLTLCDVKVWNFIIAWDDDNNDEQIN